MGPIVKVFLRKHKLVQAAHDDRLQIFFHILPLQHLCLQCWGLYQGCYISIRVHSAELFNDVLAGALHLEGDVHRLLVVIRLVVGSVVGAVSQVVRHVLGLVIEAPARDWSEGCAEQPPLKDESTLPR